MAFNSLECGDLSPLSLSPYLIKLNLGIPKR
jgi:hypothetical protein